MKVHGKGAAPITDRAETSCWTIMLVFCFPVTTSAVETLLVLFLLVSMWVPENSFTVSYFELSFLWNRKSVVHHHLVVSDKVHFPRELRVEVILTLTVDVTLLLHGCSVTHISLTESIHSLVILSQIVVECTFSMSWSILNSKTSRCVRYVCISAASVVNVNNRLWMNVSQIMTWTLLWVVEGT